MFDIFFKRSNKTRVEKDDPMISFGRYSDNNKPLQKVEKWTEADVLFKEKKFHESIAAFFQYLNDEEVENVKHEKTSGGGKFEICQGSKIISGFFNDEVLQAEVALAIMPQPSVPVMRRLLEMNFHLYYTHYAIKEDKLFMLMTSEIETANPSKLYYGLKELSTKADKHDDQLIQDFTSLLPTGIEHIEELDEAEREVKFKYFQKWIQEALDVIEKVDADKFSGGIAYLLLALAYRIDYLIAPHGRLLTATEKIVSVYFRKEERSVTEKNAEMVECLLKLSSGTKEEFFLCLFRSKYTFSIVNPQNHKTISDAIYNANQSISWYKENKQPVIAAQIGEYGLSYCQYSYSLPKPVAELYQLFMMISYPDFFKELGFSKEYYNAETKEYNPPEIIEKIKKIEEAWKEKYPALSFKTEKLRFDNRVSFNQSFATEIEYLNLDTK